MTDATVMFSVARFLTPYEMTRNERAKFVLGGRS